MKGLLSWACFLSAGILAAHAQEKPWPPAVRFEGVEAGRYQQWRRPLPCRNGQLSFFVELHDPKVKEPWEASADVRFFAPGKNQSLSYGISTVARATSTLYPGYLYVHEEKQEGRPYRHPLAVGERVKVELAWTDARKSSATVDGVAMPTITAQAEFTEMGFQVTGAAVLFSDIVLECGLIS